MKAILISGAAALLLFGIIAGSSRAQSLTTTEEGVIGGAALGAGTGAIVGAGVHHAGKGALIGAGLGAVTGGVVGHELQNQQNTQRQLQGEVSAQQRQIDHQRAEIEELKQDQPGSSDGPQANQHLQETE
jgi:outer membrane lipoprotein SlyB